jgi:hypothetical protein
MESSDILGILSDIFPDQEFGLKGPDFSAQIPDPEILDSFLWLP